jgi:PAS domain S-box-containing protein
MKQNKFVVTGTSTGPGNGKRPADNVSAPKPEQLQQVFAKELLEFGPAMFLADVRGEIQWSNAAFRRIADTKLGVANIAQALALSDVAEEMDLNRKPIFREDTLGGAAGGQILRSRHVPLFDETGRLTGFGGLVTLTSEMDERADETPLILERHMDFIRMSSDWMWETDATLNLQMVTHRVNNVLGITPHEMIGKNLLSMISSEPLRDALKRRLDRLSPFRDQPFDADDATGKRKLFLMSAAPVFDKTDGSLKGYRGCATDITELTRREESLRTAKETAETASRSKSHFLANMSHELKTPLNAIIGFTDVMRMGLLGPVENPEYRTYVKDINTSANKLLGSINDILDVSRIEAGNVELHESAVNIEELFESAARLIRDRLDNAGLKLVVDLPSRLPRLHGDKRKVKQILVNLLANAVKFTPAGGRVKLSAGVAENGGLRLVVEDTGIGIAPNHLQAVMEPFAQVETDLDRRFEGLGLGLPLSRGLARLHGGDLVLESQPGKGTTAILTLPPDRSIEGNHLTAVK